jgi:hypothetical protein
VCVTYMHESWATCKPQWDRAKKYWMLTTGSVSFGIAYRLVHGRSLGMRQSPPFHPAGHWHTPRSWLQLPAPLQPPGQSLSPRAWATLAGGGGSSTGSAHQSWHQRPMVPPHRCLGTASEAARQARTRRLRGRWSTLSEGQTQTCCNHVYSTQSTQPCSAPLSDWRVPCWHTTKESISFSSLSKFLLGLPFNDLASQRTDDGICE